MFPPEALTCPLEAPKIPGTVLPFLILQHWPPMEHHYKCVSFRNYSHFRNCQQQEVLCVFPSLFSTSFSFINKIQAIPIPYRTCKIIRCKVYLFNSHLTWHVGRRRVFAQLLSRPSEIIKDRANIFNWRGSTCSYVLWSLEICAVEDTVCIKNFNKILSTFLSFKSGLSALIKDRWRKPQVPVYPLCWSWLCTRDFCY